MKIKIGTVDDHQLFSKSLGMMLASFQNFEVVLDAVNGIDLQDKIKRLQKKPDILLIDVNMPLMNGVQTAAWMRQHFPEVKLAALSMNDNEQSIIEMFSAGCCAYLFKDTHPDDFEVALNQIFSIGYYNSDPNLLRAKKKANNPSEVLQLSEKEKQFLVHACSEKTYELIAKAMGVSERTVDGYRESVFKKLGVQTRTGMALEAIRRGFIKVQ